MNINQYFKNLEKEVKNYYEIAGRAREKGLDPSTNVEIPLAMSLAERVLGLVSVLYPQINDKRIAERIQELEKIHGALDPAVALVIAEEVAKEKFCKFENHLQAIEAGIRVALGYLTLGYVSSPIEGFIQLKLKKTLDGKDYFAPYYSGPIRSAGGTEAAFSLVVVDYLREIFGYAKYDATMEESKRGIHECYEYHERVNNLQYLPSEEELDFLLRNVPVQISGDPSEDKEVFNYKDLERIETNFLRSGFALVTGEGLAQKAPKILMRIKKLREKGFKLSDWDWLEDFVKLQKKIKDAKKGDASRAGATYIQDLVGGRPVFAHPSRSGGFRLRYGRARNTGYSTLALHPATMAVTRGFIAIGTQLKIEKPTKGCTAASCDEIDGPIVLLKDRSVRKLKNFEEAAKLYDSIAEIIYLGDILVPYGDFFNRNHVLEKPGYVEEWWKLELEKAIETKAGVNEKEIKFDEALKYSLEFKIPLHPFFIFYWSEIDYVLFLSLLDWCAHGVLVDEKLVLPYTQTDKERFAKGKRALELIGCEHEVTIENVVVKGDEMKALLCNLGVDYKKKNLEEGIEFSARKLSEGKSFEGNVLDAVNKISNARIKDKSGTFVGARMGRPEKAKLRKLTGSPHVLFPVGEQGGRLRSVMAALDVGFVKAEFANFYCDECKKDSVYLKCESCGKNCRRYTSSENNFGEKEYSARTIDVRSYFESARKRAGVRREEIPILKGVRGTSNKEHRCENLAKGLLRAKYNLHVNKDGTVRYDMTEMPITHFKAVEIGTSVEKLRELGYEKDIHGKKLESEEQVLEIFPHDIILPACPETPDERADDVFLNVVNFVDEEFEKLYGIGKIYNARKKEELVGKLFGCMSPHTSASVVGRLIGFSKVQALLASPYIHAAMRRDCLGEDSFVSVKINGKWKIEKIGKLIEEFNPKDRLDNFGTLGRKLDDVKIFSNPGVKRASEATKHSPSEMIKLYLEDGRKIELTENHKVYLKGKVEKRARNIAEGDQVTVSYKKEIEEKDIEEIFLPEIFSGDAVMIRNVRNFFDKIEKQNRHSNFYQRDSYPIEFVKDFLEKNNLSLKELPTEAKIAAKRDNVEIPIRIKLSKELLEVIGLYIAEGHLRKGKTSKGFYQISIAGNSEVKNYVKKVFYSHFELKESYENKDSVTFSSRIVYELFKNYLNVGGSAREKRIPSLFLDLKKEKLAALLRGYFEGDGSVSESDIRVCCDTVSEGLKHDLSFVLSRFGIYTKFYEYEKEPGEKVKEFYIRKKREIPKFKITKTIILSDFVKNFAEIGFISKRKKDVLERILKRNPYGTKIEYDEMYAYPKVVKIERTGNKKSYCFNIDEEHNFFANDLLVHNCDGDEAAVLFLMDLLLNFSRSFIPSHRGGTQDAPLVLNARIRANEVDDMIFDVDVSKIVPLELYEAAEKKKQPYDVKMEQVKSRLGGEKEFEELNFSFDTGNFNIGPLCSSYKTLPTMQDKVDKMMELCKKIRAVDVSDVARLVIERHFIRDIRGNLRKFSMQVFRCVGCNEKFRRPPLTGKCTRCGGKIIFTISEGSILKYMLPALNLAREYGAEPYLLESLELTEMYIQSIFGKEKEKQEALGKWF